MATVTGTGSTIELTGTNTVNSPAVTNGFVSSGSFSVGLRNGAEGELQILDGGRVSISGPNSGMVIGDDAGAQGLVIVDGANSLLEAEQRIAVGMAISPDGTPDGAGTPENGGVGELRITNGGTVETGNLFVGERSVLDINGGTLNFDEFSLWGRLEIGRDVVGTATFDNAEFLFAVGSVWVIDVDGFGAGQADFVTFTGDGDDVNTRFVPFALDLDDTVDVSTGDQIAIAEWTGALTNVTDRVLYDQNRGLEFSLEQQGNQIVLIAQEDSLPPDIVGDDLLDDTLDGTVNGETLIGLAGNDILNGNGGDDLLNGGPGADSLNGGAASDTATYIDATGGVTADLQNAGGNTGEAAGDTYDSVENLEGSAHADDLRGDGVANTISGLAGDDMIYGRAGGDMLFGGTGDDILIGGLDGDLLDGGSGQDEARYHQAGAGLLADLASSNVNTGEAAGDTYVSIEDLFGSNFADTLNGDDAANVLSGHGGNDTINGRGGADTLLGGDGDDNLIGGAGVDTYNGGNGIDRVQYQDSLVGLRVDLLNPATNTGDAAGETYLLIEDILALSGDDSLFGNASANKLYGFDGVDRVFGRAGNDTLFGGDGDDIVNGGAGNDILVGGADMDTFRFDGVNFGSDRIADFTPGETIDLTFYAGLTFGDLTIVDVAGRAEISFANGDIVMTGILAADVMQSWFDFAP
jgi:Ca2+-binding RTX toxin-like protein